MIRFICLAMVSLASIAWSLPACDTPEARKQLVATWDQMAKTKGGELVGSTVKVWNLRQDGKPGECRADFLAVGKASRIGGSLPFATSLDASGRLKLKGRGEPTLNLLQDDSVAPGARPTR
ncbi:MAG: hypothetical protein RL173_2527 [Fibrobacterota bacterium]|jgi:hypothetical protein